jgi:hypothetical protein
MVGQIRIHESKNDKCWMFSIEASPVALKSFMVVKGYIYVECEICRSEFGVKRSDSVFSIVVLRIRIRKIRMLLCLLDPDPLVRSTDPAQNPFIIMQKL